MNQQSHPSNKTSSHSYTKKSDQYMDIRSSAFALLVVGLFVLILLILQITGITHIPIIGKNNPLMTVILAVLGFICVVGGCFSLYQASKVKLEISLEEQRTKQILSWFLEEYTDTDIDQQVTASFPEDIHSPEVFSMHRMEMIQKYITQKYPDEAVPYIEYLCEDIYQKLYENADFRDS